MITFEEKHIQLREIDKINKYFVCGNYGYTYKDAIRAYNYINHTNYKSFSNDEEMFEFTETKEAIKLLKKYYKESILNSISKLNNG